MAARMWQKRRSRRQIRAVHGTCNKRGGEKGAGGMTADWDDLRIILALARSGSFKAAARQLAINESTAIRRLAQAEARFDARLFERRRGGLAPTEAGVRIIERAGRIEAEYQSAVEAVAGTDLRAGGNVRLTAVPILANHVLVPAMPELFRTHPHIRLELVAEPRRLSLEDREADIALRFARPQDGAQCVTRKIADIAYGVYGAVGRDPAALPWIGYEAGMKELPQVGWMAEMDGATRADGAGGLRVNDAETLLAAIRSGQGKGFLPVIVGAAQPGLCRLDGEQQIRERELWLVMHRAHRRHPRIRAVIDWIAARFAQSHASGPGQVSGQASGRAGGPPQVISAATTAASLVASSGLSSTSSMPAAMKSARSTTSRSAVMPMMVTLPAAPCKARI
jgi:DNA-binding transcriptional LysR family regulator